jgi:hypothetical protein
MNHLDLSLSVSCPYCENYSFSVDIPPQVLREGAKNGSPPPYPEVESLPYTRDIGRFDPKEGQTHGEWSRVGTDFLAVISFHRIGILRVEDEHEIYYRVARCRECQSLFDVFANYTKESPLLAIWPQVLGEDKDVVRTQPLLPGGITVILLYMFSFLPNILMNWSIIEKPGGLEQFFRGEWPIFLIRGIGALLLVLMTRISSHLIQYFQKESKFAELFRIRDAKGLSYWRKFTLCRLTGVVEPGKLFAPTQIMIISGIPIVFVFLIIWAATHVQIPIEYVEILLAICLFGYMVGSSLQRVITARRSYNQENKFKLISLILPVKAWSIIGVLMGIGAWAVLFSWRFFLHQNGYTIAANLTELIFWLIVAYYVGTCTWRVSEIPVYVLRGIKRIPLRMQTLRQFNNLEILEWMGMLSTVGMLTLFLAVMGLLLAETFIPAVHQSWWIVVSAQIAFIMLYVFIAIAHASTQTPKLISLVGIYILLQIGLGSNQTPGPLTQMIPSLLSHPLGGNLLLYQYCILLLFGLFSSYIFSFQAKEMYDILNSIRGQYLDNILSFYDRGLESADKALRQMMKDSQMDISPASNSSSMTKNSWVDRSRTVKTSKELIDIICTLTTIMDTFEAKSPKQLMLRRLIATSSPLISCIVLPVLINIISSRI